MEAQLQNLAVNALLVIKFFNYYIYVMSVVYRLHSIAIKPILGSIGCLPLYIIGCYKIVQTYNSASQKSADFRSTGDTLLCASTRNNNSMQG